jgi:hypothetical protein
MSSHEAGSGADLGLIDAYLQQLLPALAKASAGAGAHKGASCLTSITTSTGCLAQSAGRQHHLSSLPHMRLTLRPAHLLLHAGGADSLGQLGLSRDALLAAGLPQHTINALYRSMAAHAGARQQQLYMLTVPVRRSWHASKQLQDSRCLWSARALKGHVKAISVDRSCCPATCMLCCAVL